MSDCGMSNNDQPENIEAPDAGSEKPGTEKTTTEDRDAYAKAQRASMSARREQVYSNTASPILGAPELVGSDGEVLVKGKQPIAENPSDATHPHNLFKAVMSELHKIVIIDGRLDIQPSKAKEFQDFLDRRIELPDTGRIVDREQSKDYYDQLDRRVELPDAGRILDREQSETYDQLDRRVPEGQLKLTPKDLADLNEMFQESKRDGSLKLTPEQERHFKDLFNKSPKDDLIFTPEQRDKFIDIFKPQEIAPKLGLTEEQIKSIRRDWRNQIIKDLGLTPEQVNEAEVGLKLTPPRIGGVELTPEQVRDWEETLKKIPEDPDKPTPESDNTWKGLAEKLKEVFQDAEEKLDPRKIQLTLEKFKPFDVDGDGNVSLTELEKFTQGLDSETATKFLDGFQPKEMVMLPLLRNMLLPADAEPAQVESLSDAPPARRTLTNDDFMPEQDKPNPRPALTQPRTQESTAPESAREAKAAGDANPSPSSAKQITTREVNGDLETTKYPDGSKIVRNTKTLEVAEYDKDGKLKRSEKPQVGEAKEQSRLERTGKPDSSAAPKDTSSAATAPRPVSPEAVRAAAETLHEARPGLVQGADKDTVYAVLRSKTQSEREAINEYFKTAYGKDLRESLKEYFKGDENGLKKAMELLNRTDTDSSAVEHAAVRDSIAGIKDGGNAEALQQSLRDQLSTMNSAQLEQVKKQYEQTYGRSIQSDLAELKNEGLISQSMYESMTIYLSAGVERRTAQQVATLANIALRAEDPDERLLLFKEAMRGNSEAVVGARSQLKDEQLAKAFSGEDLLDARDYLQKGKLSLTTLIERNTGWKDNAAAIETALRALTPAEREAALKDKATMEALRKAATSQYFGENASLQLTRWRDILSNGKETVVGDLTRESTAAGMLRVLNGMDEKTLARIKSDPSYKDEVKNAIFYGLTNENERNRVLARLSQIENLGVKEAARYAGENFIVKFNNMVKTPEAVVDSITKMRPEELQQYRTDNKYRQLVNELIDKAADGDPNLQAATRRLRAQIMAGKEPTVTVTEQLYLDAAKGASPEEIVRHVQDAFRQNPKLYEQLQRDINGGNFKTGDAQQFKEALQAALGKNYEQFGKPLIERGFLPLERVRDANAEDSVLGRVGVKEFLKDLQNLPESERQRILARQPDSEYMDKVFAGLSEDERKLALNILKNGGNMSLADQARAYTLGVGGEYEELKSKLEQLTPAQRKELENDYAKAFGKNLVTDILASKKVSDSPTEKSDITNMFAVGPKELRESYLAALNSYYRTVGFGSDAVDKTNLSGSSDQAVEARLAVADAIKQAEIEFAKLPPEQQAKLAAAADRFMSLPPEQREQLMQQLRDSVKNLSADKNLAADTAAQAFFLVAAFGTAIPTGGVSVGVLAAAAAAGGAAAKIGIRKAFLGDEYTTKDALKDGLSGALELGTTFAGGGAVQKLYELSGKRAAAAAGKEAVEIIATKQLSGALREGAEKIIEKEVAGAIQASLKAGGEISEQVLAEIAKKAAKSGASAEQIKAIQDVVRGSVQRSVTAESAKVLKVAGEAAEQAIEAVDEGIKSGVTGAAGEIINYDPSKSPEENLAMIAGRAAADAVNSSIDELTEGVVINKATEGLKRLKDRVKGQSGGVDVDLDRPKEAHSKDGSSAKAPDRPKEAGDKGLTTSGDKVESKTKDNSASKASDKPKELADKPKETAGSGDKSVTSPTEKPVLQKPANFDPNRTGEFENPLARPDPSLEVPPQFGPIGELGRNIRADGQIEVFKNSGAVVVLDAQRRPTKLWDAKDGYHTFQYENGRLSEIAYPNGFRAQRVSDNHWQLVRPDGRVIDLPNTNMDVTADGDVVRTSSDGSKQIIHPDGTVDAFDANGRVDISGADIDVEERKLAQLIEQRVPESQRKHFDDLMMRLRGREVDLQITPEETAAVYNQISRLLTADGAKPLTPLQRAQLAEQILFHAAHPGAVDQGSHNTCNVATLQSRMFTRNPSEAAKLITEVALTGKYVTKDGTTIDMSAIRGNLEPDGEAGTAINKQMAGGMDTTNFQRTFASQIFQETAVNIYWQRARELDTPNGAVPLQPGSVRYRIDQDARNIERSRGKDEQIDTGERLIDANGRILAKSPELGGAALQDINDQILSNSERGYFLGSGMRFRTSDGKVFPIDSPENFERALAAAKAEGRLPIILLVHAFQPPFLAKLEDGTYATPSGDVQHAWHVVTIGDYTPADAKTPAKLKVFNQWGRENSFVYDRQLTPAELYPALFAPKQP